MKQENQEPRWKDRHYAFFQNRECEYFPCHRIADPDRFNCLFCYCPLYALGRDCGGNFRYTDKGIKDCTVCLIPHLRENYGRIIDQYPRITERMRQLEQTLVQIDKNDKRVE
ncbi:MAG: cysteine-rich small domain-containing protein, partial [Lachnospiraceae bacterium]|nr:cysteine-rich small domain-containing protein [Lachnospiraceae bacterium]